MAECKDEGCPVVEYNGEWCPVCKIDEDGEDRNGDDYEARCDDIAAAQFEDWAHGGKQDDCDDYPARDSVTYNDAGEPIGYC